MSSNHYDYFVIGAGSGGVRSARIAATHGAKVGIAEGSAFGGTCVNLGCVPKKLMAYASDYNEHFEDAQGFGWTGDKPSFDWNRLIARKDAEIARLNGIYEKILNNNNVDIYKGYARFVDANTLDIDGQRVTADKILIAVGGKPRVPDIPGGELMATSDDIFHWPKQPKKVVIAGGGYIAVEFAHILSGLGAEVTLHYRGDLFLRGFDRDLREALAEEMRAHGVNIVFHCGLERVEKDGEGFIVYGTDGKAYPCDLALAAIGREALTAPLDLSAAGVDTADNGKIIVNEQYQTSVPHIYAVGDVTDTPQLTPIAIAEGHVLADRLFNAQAERAVNYNNIATAVFSAPPIGTVGLAEHEALDQGYDFEIYKTSFRPMKHTLSERQTKTYMKLVVDRKTDKVLGLHMLGEDAPEIIQLAAVALNAGATKADFDRTIPVHPTSSEEFVTMRTAFTH